MANPDWTDPLDWEDEEQTQPCTTCGGSGKLYSHTNSPSGLTQPCYNCDGSGEEAIALL